MKGLALCKNPFPKDQLNSSLDRSIPLPNKDIVKEECARFQIQIAFISISVAPCTMPTYRPKTSLIHKDTRKNKRQ
jgi:hypothetical protein